MHALVRPHLRQVAPPQSIDVSVPFFVPSLHCVAAHALFTHETLRQSVLVTHALVLPHGPQVGPPQSTSVSAPFFIVSEQVAAGAAQTLAVQTVLAQSAPEMHESPMAHFNAQVPPQSVSDSVPFIM